MENLELRKILSIITIVLLLSTLCLTLVPQNVSSKTQDIKISSYSYYIDNLGILDIVGEVQNIGTSTIEKVVLTADVYGSDGTIQGMVTGYAWLSYLAPQQKSPFLLEINTPIDYDIWYFAEISKIEISVKEAKEVNSHVYSDFEITVNSAGVSTGDWDRGAYWVEGVVRNIGSQTASKLVVSAVFYNSSGGVAAVGHTNYLEPSNVSPSGTVTFKVGAYDTIQFEETENRIIDSYALFVEAMAPLIEGNAPAATAPVTGSSTTTQNPSSQSSNRNSTYIIIIAVVVVFVVIAALLMTRKNTPPKVETNNQKKPANRKNACLKNIDNILDFLHNCRSEHKRRIFSV
jgi:preprotein translocase subunit SecG